jgi:hypothetical protein
MDVGSNVTEFVPPLTDTLVPAFIATPLTFIEALPDPKLTFLAAVSVSPVAPVMVNVLPAVKLDTFRSLPVVIVPVLLKLSAVNVKSLTDVTVPALVSTCAAMLTSVPLPLVVTLFPAVIDTVPSAPDVRLTAPPAEPIAPTTDIPPFVAVLSVFANVIAPGEFNAPTL